MKLLSPPTRDTRPIIDRVKESLFSVLYKYGMPRGCRVGDLFCGTGSMGLEALSRGAEFVTFIEQNPKVVEPLNRNIARAGFGDRSRVAKANAFKTGTQLLPDEPPYDLVFVDPPYVMSRDTGSSSRLGKLMLILSEQMRIGAIAAVRTERRVKLEEQYGGLHLADHRIWGNMAVGLFRREDASDQ